MSRVLLFLFQVLDISVCSQLRIMMLRISRKRLLFEIIVDKIKAAGSNNSLHALPALRVVHPSSPDSIYTTVIYTASANRASDIGITTCTDSGESSGRSADAVVVILRGRSAAAVVVILRGSCCRRS